MSISVNKVILVGNLGRDPEKKIFPDGNCLANLSVATSSSYKDKQTGENVENTQWHKVVIVGKSAEACCKYLSKGSQVYIEGSLKKNEWVDKEGNQKYGVEVRAREIVFLGSKGAEKSASPQSSGNYTTHKNESVAVDEDIPF